MTRNLILHIGHPKTGSTTIQQTFQSSRPALAEAGILHPDTGRHHNHKVLLPLFTEEEKEAAAIASEIPPSKPFKIAEKRWAGLVAQVDAVQPKTIVMSSEQLFRPRKDEFVERLAAHLKPLADSFVIAGYLREPASRALSSAQQQIKRSTHFKLVAPTYFRASLEPYQESGLGTLNIRIFDRKTLTGGDIVEDFFHQHFPDFDLGKLTRTIEANATFSAEAMALIQEVNRKERTFPGKSARFAIEAADRSLSGFSRPRLLEDIRRAIQSRCTDLDWLASEFGIEFADVVSDAMPRSEANRLCDALDRVEDLCFVDQDRKAALWHAACSRAGPIRRLYSLISKPFSA